jgi:hypothetical protein
MGRSERYRAVGGAKAVELGWMTRDAEMEAICTEYAHRASATRNAGAARSAHRRAELWSCDRSIVSRDLNTVRSIVRDISFTTPQRDVGFSSIGECRWAVGR